MLPEKPQVLIVEDDAATRLLLATVLRRLELQCTVVDDGQTAIEWLQRIRFDAVLLDLVLPRLSGFDVLRHIARKLPELLPRVVVCTALPLQSLRDCDELCSVAGVFLKPAEVFELAAIVARVSGGLAPFPAAGSHSTHTPSPPLLGGQ